MAALALATVFTTVDVGKVSAAASQGENLTALSGGSLLTSGGSGTSIELTPPANAACSGDTLAGYRVQSYMVPAAVDPSTLTFNASGPIPIATGNPTPSAFKEPLYSTTGSPIVNKNLAVGTGLLTGLPPINFSVYVAANIPDGVYNLGFACTIGAAGPAQLDRYWNIKVNFGADPQDPNGFSWNLAAPGVPTALSQSAATTTSVDFSYAAPASIGVSAVTDYQYRYGTTAIGPWTTVDTVSAAPGTQQITGLAARTKYFIQVQAKNATDGGAWKTINATTLAAAPGTPSGLAGDKKVTLTWTPSAADGGANVTYRVDYSTNDGATWTLATTAAVSPYDVTSLTNGVPYKFRVSSTTAGGNNPSGTSAAFTPAAAPAAPSGLAVTATSTTTADLSWVAPSENGGDAIIDYAIRYSATGGAPFTAVSHSASTTTAIQVTGLNAGTNYTFQVAAQNTAVGVGGFATITGTTVSQAPGTPVIGALGNGNIAVSWSPPAGTAAFTYNLDKTSNNGVTWTSVATGIATSSKLVTGLVNGTAYKFRVSATDTGGTSVVSATSLAGTPRTVPTAPGKPTVAPAKASVKLTWSVPASTGGIAITGYVVQRSTNGKTWANVTLAAPLTRTYTVTGLVNGTKYFFRVAAKNAAGTGAFSVSNYSVPRTVSTNPGKPVATAGVKSVKLTWTAPRSTGGAAITSYVVQKSLDGVHWTTVTLMAPLTRVYNVTGLTSGRAWRFRVAAKNVAGIGAYSMVTVATPK